MGIYLNRYVGKREWEREINTPRSERMHRCSGGKEERVNNWQIAHEIRKSAEKSVN